jgi:hypothetical protein
MHDNIISLFAWELNEKQVCQVWKNRNYKVCNHYSKLILGHLITNQCYVFMYINIWNKPTLCSLICILFNVLSNDISFIFFIMMNTLTQIPIYKFICSKSTHCVYVVRDLIWFLLIFNFYQKFIIFSFIKWPCVCKISNN